MLAVFVFSAAWPQEDTRPPEDQLLLEDNTQNTQTETLTTQKQDTQELPGVGAGDFIRVVVVLGIVILLIYFLVYFLRKFSGVKTETDNLIRVLSAQSLKSDGTLYLVEAGDKFFLIGGSSGNISLIKEFEEGEAADSFRLELSRNKTLTGSAGVGKFFRDILQNQTVKKNISSDTDTVEKAGEEPESFIRKQRDRLKKL